MFDILIPCATGIEAVVKRQLLQLGYPELPAVNGRIRVHDCDWEDVAMLNIFLRSGERVLVNLNRFNATTFDMLYDGVYAVDWHNYLTCESTINVVAKTVRSKLFAHHSVQGIVKKAIVSKLADKLGQSVTEGGAVTVVEIDITDDVADINIDTSGAGLHKRGYRTLAYSAPLKETTAAALIDLSFWHGDKVFYDLFCGSGTLPIECCLKALNIAPGVNRDFDYLHWDCFDRKLHDRCVERAKDGVKHRNLEVYGSDIDDKAIEIARYHARKAGVDKYITFTKADAFNFYDNRSYGVNISNPPYGQRLGDLKQVEEIATNMGKVYKKLDNWNFYFLTPFEKFERFFGRRADKKRPLFNAGIKCSYLSFNGAPPPKTRKNTD